VGDLVEGLAVGDLVVGLAVGFEVGDLVVGLEVGDLEVGLAVGDLVVGLEVGDLVGLRVGDLVVPGFFGCSGDLHVSHQILWFKESREEKKKRKCNEIIINLLLIIIIIIIIIRLLLPLEHPFLLVHTLHCAGRVFSVFSWHSFAPLQQLLNLVLMPAPLTYPEAHPPPE
jgi:hypothetical protein